MDFKGKSVNAFLSFSMLPKICASNICSYNEGKNLYKKVNFIIKQFKIIKKSAIKETERTKAKSIRLSRQNTIIVDFRIWHSEKEQLVKLLHLKEQLFITYKDLVLSKALIGELNNAEKDALMTINEMKHAHCDKCDNSCGKNDDMDKQR